MKVKINEDRQLVDSSGTPIDNRRLERALKKKPRQWDFRDMEALAEARLMGLEF